MLKFADNLIIDTGCENKPKKQASVFMLDLLRVNLFLVSHFIMLSYAFLEVGCARAEKKE